MPGGVQALARCTAVWSAALVMGGDDSPWMTGCKPRKRKLGRSKRTWPGPISGVVL